MFTNTVTINNNSPIQLLKCVSLDRVRELREIKKKNGGRFLAHMTHEKNNLHCGTNTVYTKTGITEVRYVECLALGLNIIHKY